MKRIISFVLVLIISLFFDVSYSLADEVDSNINNSKISVDSNSKSNKKNNIEKTDITNSSSDDIFGDEQAFPFIAGLGKNAAH